jgi:hypothetical protein
MFSIGNQDRIYIRVTSHRIGAFKRQTREPDRHSCVCVVSGIKNEGQATFFASVGSLASWTIFPS